jgi:hypothetical protein
MRVIIAGSRTIGNYRLVEDAVKECGWPITEVVCGKAKGVDTLGESWGFNHQVNIRYFPADWNKFGRKAGFLRNMEMAEYGEALILIWDGESKGSKMMLDIARKKGLKIYEKVV